MLSKDMNEYTRDVHESAARPPPFRPSPAYNPSVIPPGQRASAPVPLLQTIDPTIASILQQGFPSDYAMRPQQQQEGNDQPIEYVIIDESSDDDEEETENTPPIATAQQVTLDPTIASILQQGFPVDYDLQGQPIQRNNDNVNLEPSSQNSQNLMPNDIEVVIVDEPTQQDAASATAQRQQQHHPRIRHGTKANPPGAPRFIRRLSRSNSSSSLSELSEQLMPYATVLAWKTKRLSHAALRKACRFKNKHTPHVKEIAQRSASFVEETSKTSVRAAMDLSHKYGPRIKEQASRASSTTLQGIRNLEEKHHLLTKSKRGLSQGKRAVKDMWKKRRSL